MRLKVYGAILLVAMHFASGGGKRTGPRTFFLIPSPGGNSEALNSHRTIAACRISASSHLPYTVLLLLIQDYLYFSALSSVSSLLA